MQRRTLLKAFALSASVMAMGLSFRAYAAAHHQSRDHAFALRDDGDFETPLKDVALMAIDDINAKGGGAGQETGAGGGRPGLQLAAVCREGAPAAGQDKVAVVFGCWTSVSRKSVLPVFEELNGLLFYPVQYEGEEMSPTSSIPARRLASRLSRRWNTC